VRIVEQILDLGMPLIKAQRRTRPGNGVNFPGGQQAGNSFAVRCAFKPDISRQLQRDFLDSGRVLVAATHPDHIRSLYAILLLKEETDPEIVVYVPKGTKENLVGILKHENRTHAVDLYIAIYQGPDTVIVAEPR
jgi:hypothetical protein